MKYKMNETKEQFMKEFGERLKSNLRRKGFSNFSQKEFAERIGVSEVSLSNYCKGVSMPTLDTVAKMAQELNVSADFLLGNIPFIYDKVQITESYGNVARLLDILIDNKILNLEKDGEKINLYTVNDRINEFLSNYYMASKVKDGNGEQGKEFFNKWLNDTVENLDKPQNRFIKDLEAFDPNTDVVRQVRLNGHKEYIVEKAK